jgi:hypothetical protein
MPILYRGMLLDAETGCPRKGNRNGNELGVREADVVTYEKDGEPWVAPEHDGSPQGMSVSPDSGCRLPAHRRPAGPPWNGTHRSRKGAEFRVWRIDPDVFGDRLTYQPDPAHPRDHGFVSPAEAMPLERYRDLVQGTDGLWTPAPPPAPECAATSGEVPVSTSEDRVARIDAVATNAGTADDSAVDALVAELRTANAAGLGRDAVIAELTAGADRAVEAGNEDGAEALRTLLDRVHGFCGPHARIDLTP